MSRVFPHALPEQYSHEGIDHFVANLLQCNAKWVANHEVDLPTAAGAWWGFVHECRLAGHPTAEGCFVARCRGGETYTYLKDAIIPDADAAVRRMLAERRSE